MDMDSGADKPGGGTPLAFIQLRRKTKIYAYYNEGDRLLQIPRALTKHLDGQPLAVAEEWVQDWERRHGKTVQRSARIHLRPDDKLTALWAQYQTHQGQRSSRRERTAQKETLLLEKHIAPYFVGEHGKKDPAQWHSLVPGFHDYLFTRFKGRATIQKTLWTLERFGAYLVFKQHMTFPFAVQPPAQGNAKVTPLKVRLSPDEVLKYAKQDRACALMVLLGYFAALSPSELFALERADLLTGDVAEVECKTLKGLRKHGLGSRLGVRVNKTLSHAGVDLLTKNDYRTGVVNVWNADAAKMIAALMKEAPEGRLFPHSRSHNEKAFRLGVKLGCTPHDLRRASCLYLGREKRLELTLLQEHMRHAEIETTMLYCREPSVPEPSKKKVKQDWDDVA